jgi:hypothetical protein
MLGGTNIHKSIFSGGYIQVDTPQRSSSARRDIYSNGKSIWLKQLTKKMMKMTVLGNHERASEIKSSSIFSARRNFCEP